MECPGEAGGVLFASFGDQISAQAFRSAGVRLDNLHGDFKRGEYLDWVPSFPCWCQHPNCTEPSSFVNRTASPTRS